MRRDEEQIQEGSATLTVYDSWGEYAEVFRKRRLFTVSARKDEETGNILCSRVNLVRRYA